MMELLDRDLIISDIRLAIRIPPGGAKRVHMNRPSHGLAFNVDGSTVYHFSGGKKLTCRPGQCIYLPQGSCYTVTIPDEAAAPVDSPRVGVYAINFLLADSAPSRDPFVLSVRGRDKVFSCFSRAETAWRQKPVGFREECFSCLYQLIRVLRTERASYSHLDNILNKLAPALRYIEANYTTETITLPQLARLCGMSQPHMRALFRSAFSVSPSVYIRNLRINYAMDLLRAGEYSVTSAALMSGFNNTTYFAREFKKVTGVSPSCYSQQEPTPNFFDCTIPPGASSSVPDR